MKYESFLSGFDRGMLSNQTNGLKLPGEGPEITKG